MDASLYQDFINYGSLAFGLGAIAYGLFRESSKSRLTVTGIATEGIIFTQDRSFKLFRLLNSNNVNDLITVRFVTNKNEWITAEIDQAFQLFYNWQYKNGEKVKVYYDPDQPSHFYVDTKQSELGGRISVVMIGIFVTGFAAYRIFMT